MNCFDAQPELEKVLRHKTLLEAIAELDVYRGIAPHNAIAALVGGTASAAAAGAAAGAAAVAAGDDTAEEFVTEGDPLYEVLVATRPVHVSAEVYAHAEDNDKEFVEDLPKVQKYSTAKENFVRAPGRL